MGAPRTVSLRVVTAQRRAHQDHRGPRRTARGSCCAPRSRCAVTCSERSCARWARREMVTLVRVPLDPMTRSLVRRGLRDRRNRSACRSRANARVVAVAGRELRDRRGRLGRRARGARCQAAGLAHVGRRTAMLTAALHTCRGRRAARQAHRDRPGAAARTRPAWAASILARGDVQPGGRAGAGRDAQKPQARRSCSRISADTAGVRKLERVRWPNASARPLPAHRARRGTPIAGYYFERRRTALGANVARTRRGWA